MAASLIRLHFHDCFAQDCDAAVMLDSTDSIQTEKTVVPNRSLRAYSVIDAAKSAVERVCPGVVSCADILTLAARETSVYVGGPSWTVRLGRRDSNTTSFSEASAIPPSSADLDSLISSFSNKGLTARDTVTLSGAHTIGQAQCLTFRDRIYGNGTNIDPNFAITRRRQCPQAVVDGDSNLARLDLVTTNEFDNNYYRNLVQMRGLLAWDQALFNGGSTDTIVTEYSRSPLAFASAMIKMGEISPVLGENNGIIRRL